MAYDFYEQSAADTAAVLQRMQVYVDMAIKQGDVVYQEKPGQLVIRIRLDKKEQQDARQDS